LVNAPYIGVAAASFWSRLNDEGIAAQGVGGLVDLTVGEVRRLARAAPTAAGEGQVQVQTTGGAAGGPGAGGHPATVPPLEGATREPAAPIAVTD